MALYYYDEAILNKLKFWVGDANIKITSPDETKRLFQYKADIENDEPIKLPLITLRRNRDINILDTNKKPLVFDGLKLNNNGDQSDQLNGIPIALNYTIDIYTRYERECQEYMRNFIFNIIKFPKIQIQIPYNNSNINHNSFMRLTGDVSDNSEIPERLVAGQFTRFTIPFNVDDAYLFDYRFRPNYKIDGCEVEVKFRNEEYKN